MDINTLADLLNGFISAENEVLKLQDISHTTTIGTMYEGLTADVLNKSVFAGLNLNIVKNSFIAGCKTEFDILLVEGEGEQIPYTERYKYKPEQVIAVIQVRKNLHSNDIADGYESLKPLVEYYENRQPEQYMVRLFRDAFRAICRKDISALKAGTLSENEKLIYDVLRQEVFMPVRIIWGYNGFKSELKFRESLVSYLSDKSTTDVAKRVGGFGPHNFPSLIICGQYSMFKQNGMPFGIPMQENDWWSFYTSSSYNPTYFLLEVIWSRLCYKFGLSDSIFGEDLNMEPANWFLDGRIKELNGYYGWEYNYQALKDKTLQANTDVVEWSPVELDDTQHCIMQELCNKGEIDLSDKDLESYVLSGSYTSLSDFVGKLKGTGLIHEEKGKIKLLTDGCQCVIVKGKFYAAENKSGRLTNWMLKEREKSKANVPQ
ncbi:MAG: DUF6602 domain-containing protein [Bacteroidia bacterium]